MIVLDKVSLIERLAISLIFNLLCLWVGLGISFLVKGPILLIIFAITVLILYLFSKDKKWFYWSYGGGFFILLLLVSQTYLDVLFNSWYKDFYDILQTAEKRNISEFWDSIEKFLYIALPYVTLFAFTNWFTRLWAFRWREAMTFSYMPYWRAVDATVEGASQRIQEDAMNFAKIVESLGLQIVRAIMLLIAFINLVSYNLT